MPGENLHHLKATNESIAY